MENTTGNNDLNSLETPEGASKDTAAEKPVAPKVKKSPVRRIRDFMTHLNIYLLLFILIVIIAAGLVFVGWQNSKKQAATPEVKTQELDQTALDKLNGNETKVGDPKQTLSIESNTIFSGKVLVRDSLDVAGSLKVGGALSLPGITVSGASNFDQVQANSMSIAGNATIQGTLSVQKNIAVSGGATFSQPISAPQITVSSIQLSGDLTISRHIDAGGATPSKADGGALGAGGTASLSGTDTAGSITVNTGSGPVAGCFISITFVTKFNDVPHVVITPVGSAAAGLNYYVNRTTSGFSVCTTNSAPAGQTFGFDYIVID